jgi:hypothetical protein
MFIVQAYQTSQYVVPRGGIFLVHYTWCSLCRLSDFSVRGAARRHFSRPIYKVFIMQAYQTSQYVVPRGGMFLGKWRSSFAGNSDGKMNVQSACALNTR